MSLGIMDVRLVHRRGVAFARVAMASRNAARAWAGMGACRGRLEIGGITLISRTAFVRALGLSVARVACFRPMRLARWKPVFRAGRSVSKRALNSVSTSYFVVLPRFQNAFTAFGYLLPGVFRLRQYFGRGPVISMVTRSSSSASGAIFPRHRSRWLCKVGRADDSFLIHSSLFVSYSPTDSFFN